MTHTAAPSRLSVALCTYNGARFLSQQLESIAAQTRLPDELVVCDDGSTDNTLATLDAFALTTPFPVRIFRNPHTLGSTANFEQAIRKCRGDLITLCDQDDLWLPERLAASESFLMQHPEAVFVFTEAYRIDEASQRLPGTLWDAFHFTGDLRRRFRAGDNSVLLRHRFITGATVTLRVQLLPHVLPFPRAWVHDEWLAAVTPFFGQIGMLEEALVSYRIHAAQQVGSQAARAGSPAAHWARIHRQRDRMRHLLAHLAQHPPQRNRDLLSAYRALASFLEFRATLPAHRLKRFARVVLHLRGYRQHAAGFGSAIKDILLPKPAPQESLAASSSPTTTPAP